MKVRVGWLGLAVLLGVALAGCGSSSAPITISISPTSGTVLLGTSIQFTPAEAGSENGIQWSVNGVANGNATVGTIDSTGLYTAPATLPTPPSGVVAPVIFCTPSAAVPNSGSAGATIELAAGPDYSNFVTGNTITITGNSVANWNASFVIVFSATLSNGNFGVQIATQAGPPPIGYGGTATVTPGLTITAQVENTDVAAAATITLDSGIRVSLSQSTFTIGTNEQFLFGPTVSVTGTTNQLVNWSVSGIGTIDPVSGLYVAPSTTGTATVTASSVVDSSQSASATVTIVTAADPTVTSISPTSGALGAAFQEVFLTGTNFISTTNVFVNGSPLPTSALTSTTSSTLFVVVPDSVLSTLPASLATTVTLTFTVARQSGAQQSCSPNPCQVSLSPVRPAVVSVSPDTIQQSAINPVITVDGGYFGTLNTTLGFSGNKVVSLQFNGNSIPNFGFLTDRQLQFTVPSTFVAQPGLYPITVTSDLSGSPNGSMAAINLAVQPTSISATPSAVAVGSAPSSVAINTATGIAVVAEQGVQVSGGRGHDIALIDLTQSPPALQGFICTEAVGSVLSPPPTEPACPGAGPGEPLGPVSVAVDNLRNLALVANSGNSTLAVVNLTTRTVTALITFPSADTGGNPFALVPRAVGINPVSGRALVAFSASTIAGSNAGAILDMNLLRNTQGVVSLPPAVINVVNINNGLSPHIAVSPRLNWAVSTPGGTGAISIVDLGRQTTNQLNAISCAPGSGTTPATVSVSTTTTVALQVGQPVLITGVSPVSFDGMFSVTSVNNTAFQYLAQAPCPSSATAGSGGFATYALPVASVAADLNLRGVSINDETQKALLIDPAGAQPPFVFNILDQTSSLVNNLPSSAQINNVASAMNPLTNIGVIVNQGSGVAYVVSAGASNNPPTYLSTINTGASPVDVAIDSAANNAVVVNQGSNNVSVFSLGAASLRSGAPQIIESSAAPVGSTQSSSQVVLTSSLGSPAAAANQTVTLIGHFTAGSVPRLDGNPSAFSNVAVSLNGRELTATLSGATLAANGPRQYDLDAFDSSLGASNAARLQAIEAVSLITGDCSNPAPQGVAVGNVQVAPSTFVDVAVVTEPGCNDVSLVNLATGTGFGSTPELAVQSNPQGVGVYPQSGLAVVANAGSNSVSIVDMVNDAIANTFSTDPIPDGVAIDLGTGNALVTANGASLVDTFPVSTASQTPTTITAQQSPSGVAVDALRGVAVVANSAAGSNDASVLDLATNSATLATPANGIVFPQGVAFDPISDTFMITSSASNQVVLLNPVSGTTSNIRVGIDPSSIAYNFETGTLVTANNLSKTVTVMDFLTQTVQAVFSLPSSTQFGVAIQPQTNLAVVADPADNELLLVPLPH